MSELTAGESEDLRTSHRDAATTALKKTGFFTSPDDPASSA